MKGGVLMEHTKIKAYNRNDTPKHIGEIIAQGIMNVSKPSTLEHGGVSSSYNLLDNILDGGFVNGTLSILGNRRGMGGSIFIANLARRIAVRGRNPVLLFSNQTTQGQMIRTMVCSQSNISLKEYNSINDKVKRKLRILSKSPIFLDFTPELSLEKISNTITCMIKNHNIKVVFIDNIKNLVLTKRDISCMNCKIPVILKTLKELAVQNEIPIIAHCTQNEETSCDFDIYPSSIREFPSPVAFFKFPDNILLLHLQYTGL